MRTGVIGLLAAGSMLATLPHGVAQAGGATPQRTIVVDNPDSGNAVVLGYERSTSDSSTRVQAPPAQAPIGEAPVLTPRGEVAGRYGDAASGAGSGRASESGGGAGDSPARAAGPGIPLITGGDPQDGHARVGRLPILE